VQADNVVDLGRQLRVSGELEVAARRRPALGSGLAVPAPQHMACMEPVGAARLRQRSRETPESDKRSVTEIEADEVGASLKWATAKVERASQRGHDERSSGSERQAERGDFNDPPPF
jgi:hypothetical protein